MTLPRVHSIGSSGAHCEAVGHTIHDIDLDRCVIGLVSVIRSVSRGVGIVDYWNTNGHLFAGMLGVPSLAAVSQPL